MKLHRNIIIDLVMNDFIGTIAEVDLIKNKEWKAKNRIELLNRWHTGLNAEIIDSKIVWEIINTSVMTKGNKSFFNSTASHNHYTYSLQYNLLTTSHLQERKTSCFSIYKIQFDRWNWFIIYLLVLLSDTCAINNYATVAVNIASAALNAIPNISMNTITIFDSSGYNALNAFQSGLFSSICSVFIHRICGYLLKQKVFSASSANKNGRKTSSTTEMKEKGIILCGIECVHMYTISFDSIVIVFAQRNNGAKCVYNILSWYIYSITLHISSCPNWLCFVLRWLFWSIVCFSQITRRYPARSAGISLRWVCNCRGMLPFDWFAKHFRLKC